MVQSPPKTQEQINQEAFTERMEELKARNEQDNLKYEQTQELKQKELDSGLGSLVALPIVGLAGLFKNKETEAKNAIVQEKKKLFQKYEQYAKEKENKAITKFKKENPKATKEQLSSYKQTYRIQAQEKKALFQSNTHYIACRNFERNLIRQDPTGQKLKGYYNLLGKKESLQKWHAGQINSDISVSKNLLLQLNAEKQLTNIDPISRSNFLKSLKIKEKNILGIKRSNEKIKQDILRVKAFNNNVQSSINARLEPSFKKWQNHPYIKKEKNIIVPKKLTPDELNKFTQNLEHQKNRYIFKRKKQQIAFSGQNKQRINAFVKKHPNFVKEIKRSPHIDESLVKKPNFIDYINRLAQGIKRKPGSIRQIPLTPSISTRTPASVPTTNVTRVLPQPKISNVDRFNYFINRLRGYKNPAYPTQGIIGGFPTLQRRNSLTSRFLNLRSTPGRFIRNRFNLAKKTTVSLFKKMLTNAVWRIAFAQLGALLLLMLGTLIAALGLGSQ